MRPVLSRAQSRAFDSQATQRCGVPSLLLMENAGRGAAEVVARLLGEQRGKLAGASVLVVTGAGNNGGDGYVLARRLLVLGARVRVRSVVPVERVEGDARVMLDAWRGIGGELAVVGGDAGLEELEQLAVSSDAVVDAVLGTGLERPVSGFLALVVELLNGVRAPVIALDLPSGIGADRGEVLGVAVRARHTLTFGHPKLGLYSTAGVAHAGELHVVDIGVPASIVREVGHSAELAEPSDFSALLRPRSRSTHKGSAGRVLVFAGSPGKLGAALLCGEAALRAGAGLVTLAGFGDATALLDARVTELMTHRLDPHSLDASVDGALESANAVVIGPGFGLDDRARLVVERVVRRWTGPIVVDADALTHYAGRAALLADARGPRLLTPHPGELARLLDTTAPKIELDRWGSLMRAVELTRSTVLLKGPRTLIGAPKSLPRINPSGTPALATGGAGDVLAGIAGAFACHLSLPDAAAVAAYLHGLAGERWAAEHDADRGLLARELCSYLPRLIGELTIAHKS